MGPEYIYLASRYRQTIVGKPNYGPNWAVMLLPYIEQGPLYSKVDVKAYMALDGVGAKAQEWRNIRGEIVPTRFICPSDSAQRKPFALDGGNWARGNYAANAGPGWFNGTVGGLASRSPRNGYDPRNPAPMWGGVMGINWGVPLGNLAQQDGTSNTVMFTEVRVGLNVNDQRGVWAMGLAGASVTVANGSTGDCKTPNGAEEFADDIEDCDLARKTSGFAARSGMGASTRMGCSNDNLPRNWPNWQAGTRSMHFGIAGVNVVFADGAVRWVVNSVPPTVWDAYISRNDGQSLNRSFDF